MMTLLHVRSHDVTAVLQHQATAAPGTQWVASCQYAQRVVWGFGLTDLGAITHLLSQLRVK